MTLLHYSQGLINQFFTNFPTSVCVLQQDWPVYWFPLVPPVPEHQIHLLRLAGRTQVAREEGPVSSHRPHRHRVQHCKSRNITLLSFRSNFSKLKNWQSCQYNIQYNFSKLPVVRSVNYVSITKTLSWVQEQLALNLYSYMMIYNRAILYYYILHICIE